MPDLWKKILFVLPVAGLMIISLGACAHERFHRNLNVLHEDFHAQPHSRAAHDRFHEGVRDLHEAEHDRGYYRDRFYERDPYYGDPY